MEINKNKRNNTSNSKKNWIKLIITLLVVIFVVLSIGFSSYHTKEEMNFNDFITHVENNEVKSVKGDFKTGASLSVTLTNGDVYKTSNPKSEGFKRELLESNIQVKEIEHVSTMNVIFTIGEIIIFILIFRTLSKTMSSFKKKPKDMSLECGITTTKMSDVCGIEEIKDDVNLLIKCLKEPELFKDRGVDLPKGVILYGEPGTGKTLLARAIASEAGVPFFQMSGSDFVELYAGLGAKKVRDLFKIAREKGRCVIFIDEIDAIGRKRNGANQHSEERQTLNALLTEMDGFISNEGILVIAATNRLNDLDGALLRAGRFDKHICVPLPETPKDRLEILNLYKKNRTFAEDVDLEAIAKETIGFSPAELESLMNEAALVSCQFDKKEIDKECFEEALYRKLLKGHAKKEKTTDKEKLELIAWHEAGHAVIALLQGNEVTKVTITPSTSGAGGATFITPKNTSLLSLEELKQMVRQSYGGRMAEFIFTKDSHSITMGAHNDIQKATQIIYQMITEYGFSEKYGMLNLNDLKADTKEILKEVMKCSQRLEGETLSLLENNFDLLKAIATKLLEKETLYKEDLIRIQEKEDFKSCYCTIEEIIDFNDSLDNRLNLDYALKKEKRILKIEDVFKDDLF